MNNAELKFHHSEAIVTDNIGNKENNAIFKVSQYYENNTNEDIIVLHRNNLPIKIPRHLTGYTHSKLFILRTIYSFTSNTSIIDAINNINEIIKATVDNNEDLVLIKTALLNNYNNDYRTNYCSVVIERTLDINLLKQHENIYMPENDVLVCFRNVNLNQLHPFSNNGQTVSEYHKFISNRKVSGVFVELIDNENNIGNRYMYVAKQLMEIPTRKDPNKKSGVYFTKASNDRLDNIQIQPEFYDIEESEEQLGLYKTKEDAMTNGAPDLLYKNKIKTLERELFEAKLDSERDNLERDTVIRTLQHEVEKAKLETIRAKEDADKAKAARTEEYESRSSRREDYYEQRSYARKDTHEIIKYLPGIALGIIGAVAYVNTKKS